MGSSDEQRPSLEISFGRPKKAKTPRPEAARPAPEAVREPVAPEPVTPKPKKARIQRTPRPAPVRDPKPPRQPYSIAATSVITGLTVGLLLVGAAAAALEGCAGVRGTSSCGTAGMPILAIILALGVYVGGLLVRFLSHSASAMSISFLALAFVAVVCCLLLLDVLDGVAALIIVPALSVVGYLGAHAVTTRYIEPADDH